MSKAIIVVDFAYKSPKRNGRGTGQKGLRSTLKYLQYRDKENNQRAQRLDYERWRDRGMGLHWREIYQNSGRLQSPHVLAWTWVVSPSPDLMELVPAKARRQLVCDLTERVVEDYYLARGFDVPEYSYILHDRQTNAQALQQLHTHVILPGTASEGMTDRSPVYNNVSKKHDVLFRNIATQHFERALDEIVGPEWRKQRELEPDLSGKEIEP